jgi:uncharacterized membrane protein
MTNTNKIVKIVGLGLLTAIVVVLQIVGSFIKFGTFSVSLVLIPIVVGAALYGVGAGAWLGLVFGVVVLASGDASLFLGFNVAGTIITVLAKGVLAGLASGLVYKALEKVNKYLAVIVSAIVCPVVNTGVFIIGCYAFFFNDIKAMAGGTNVFAFIITSMVTLNFVFELGANLVLGSTIVRVINIGRKEIKA